MEWDYCYFIISSITISIVTTILCVTVCYAVSPRLLQPYEQQSWHDIFNYNTHTNNLTTTQEAAC